MPTPVRMLPVSRARARNGAAPAKPATAARPILHLPGLMALALLATGCALQSNVIGDADRALIMASVTWDRNRDGVVTCEEWTAYAAALFASADRDHDGVLDANEFVALTVGDKTFVIADLAYFDANGDGRVSRAEFTDRPNPAFVLLDKDRNCRLTPDELTMAQALWRSMPTDAPPPGGKDKGGAGAPP